MRYIILITLFLIGCNSNSDITEVQINELIEVESSTKGSYVHPKDSLLEISSHLFENITKYKETRDTIYLNELLKYYQTGLNSNEQKALANLYCGLIHELNLLTSTFSYLEISERNDIFQLILGPN